MENEFVDQIVDILTNHNITLDNDDKRFIQKLIDGWEDIRPISWKEKSENDGPVFLFSEENHYMEKVGAQKCNGSIRAYSSNQRYSSKKTYKCSETFEGVAIPTSKATIYKLDLSHSNFSLTKKSAELTSISYKEALATAEGWEDTEISLSYLTNLDNCKAAVQSLSESIFDFLEVLGYLELSSISNKEQLEVFHDEVLTLLAHAERDRRVYGLLKFAPSINDSFLQVMNDTKKDDSFTLSWLYAGGNIDVQKNRLKAVKTHPLFLRLFVNSENENLFASQDEHREYDSLNLDVEMLKVRSRYRGISREHYLRQSHKLENINDKKDALINYRKKIKSLVDQGEDVTSHLVKAVSVGHTISESTIQKLSRIKTYPSNIDFGSFLGAVQYLDKIDETWFPKNSNELGAFVESIWKAKELAKLTHKSFEDVLQNINGRWVQWNNSVGSIENIQSISEWLEELNKTIILPQVLSELPHSHLFIMTNSEAFAAYSEDYKRHYSFSFRDTRDERMRDLLHTKEQDALMHILTKSNELDILSCAVSWQREKEEYAKNLEELSDRKYAESDSWIPLSKQVESPNGYIISPINNKNDLKELSEVLNSSMGAGARGCLYNHMHIVSLRKKGDKEINGALILKEIFNSPGHVSALDPEFIASDLMLSFRRNASPTPAQRTAMEWYVNELFHSESIKPDWVRIAKEREQNRKLRINRYLVNSFGFNPLEENQRQQAFDNFKKFLPDIFKVKEAENYISYETLYTKLKLNSSALITKFNSLKVSNENIDHVRRGLMSFR